MNATFFRRTFLLLWLTFLITFPLVVLAETCSGFASQLKIGNQARVTPGSANNVRQNPGTSHTKIGQIPGNQLVMVIGGPACANNVTWWQVNFNGLIGWTGEGQGSQHWMDTNVTAASQPDTPLNGLEGTAATTLFVDEFCVLESGQPIGRAVIGSEGQTVANGTAVAFSISEKDYTSAPDLCVPARLAGTASAVSPFGTTITPRIEEQSINSFSLISLPLWAYSVPGRWQLSVQGFSIFIDVQPAAKPTFQRFIDELLLGGFRSGERVVIVYGLESDARSSSGVPNPFGVQFDRLEGLEVVADANGYFVGSLSLRSNQRLVAAVSESGAVVNAPRLRNLVFPGSDEGASRQALYQAFFGQRSAGSSGVGPQWSGPQEVGTGWQDFIGAFAGDDGVIYAIQPDGTLLWYLHAGFGDGSFNWAGPTNVGNGWSMLNAAFTSDNGVVYAVSLDGDLWWYRHDGRFDGSATWAGIYPVGFGGWDQYHRVFGGDNGAIYAVTSDGNLLWYQHQNYLDGTADFIGPVQVGFGGWTEFQWLFAGEGGVIYGIYPDGRLFRYIHYGYLDGSADWAEHQEIGTGWQDFGLVFAGEGSVIYAIRQDGVLLWYRYEG